jgi:hypothetical protein
MVIAELGKDPVDSIDGLERGFHTKGYFDKRVISEVRTSKGTNGLGTHLACQLDWHMAFQAGFFCRQVGHARRQARNVMQGRSSAERIPGEDL